jgi:hypothetical protein
MKTRILFVLISLLPVVQIAAQRGNGNIESGSGSTEKTYYYDVTKTFYESGYAYQCDVSNILVTLYNKANRLTYVDWTLKDGSRVPKEYFEGEVDFLEDDTWTKPKCTFILNSSFMPERIKSGSLISVTMYIDPDTGKVIEVDFKFDKNKDLGTIPVSVYRAVELKLKSEVWFTPTEAGKKLNYIMRGWMHEMGGKR